MVLVILATTKDPPTGAASNVASSLVGDANSSADEEIWNEEMVHSYRAMYKKLVEALNKNHDLRRQVSLLRNDKEGLVKQNNMLRDMVCQQ